MLPDLIIFDCDGVLIDSEFIASTVVAADLSGLGWAMTPAEAMAEFLGMSIIDMVPVIEARLGLKLAESWRPDLAQKLLAALSDQARIIPGAREMLESVTHRNIPWRVASNSSDEEMAVKFSRTGIAHLTAGRTHSAASVIRAGGRPKPAPDLFLAAAAAEPAHPGNCLVLEDSALGVTGAVAAGMHVYGFAPHTSGAHLLAAGAAKVVHSLNDFMETLA